VLEHLQPRKLRVGVLDFGDGRSFLQAPLEPVNRRFRQQLVGRLEADGIQVVEGDEGRVAFDGGAGAECVRGGLQGHVAQAGGLPEPRISRSAARRL
jgi:hypothetical protein